MEKINGKRLTIIAGAGVIIGALLPWTRLVSAFETYEKLGYETDGIFTGAFGLIIIITGLIKQGKPRKSYSIAAAILSLMVVLISIMDIADVNSVIKEDVVGTGSALVGLYVTLIAGVLGVVGGFWKYPSIPDSERKNIIF